MSRKSAADHPHSTIKTSLLAIRPSDASHKAFLASKWADKNFGTGWGLGVKPFVGFTRPRIESFVIDAIASNGSTILVHRTTDSEKPVSIAVFETFDTISGEGQWKHTKLLEIKVVSAHRQIKNSSVHMIETVIAYARKHCFWGEAFVVVVDCAVFQTRDFEKLGFVRTNDVKMASIKFCRMERRMSAFNLSCRF
jgi:hypothetical protein